MGKIKVKDLLKLPQQERRKNLFSWVVKIDKFIHSLTAKLSRLDKMEADIKELQKKIK